MAELQRLGNALLLPLELIRPNPRNVRSDLGDLSELKASIESVGLLQPVLVYPHDDGRTFVLEAGHRRVEALRQLAFPRVPAVVLPNKGRLQSLKRMLIENGQRRELSPLDEAQAIKALLNEGLTQNQVAAQIGRSNAWVSTRVRLLDLPPDQQALINNKRMTLTEAEVVTETRTRNERSRAGHKVDPERGWAPKHFTVDHPQATEAARRCEGAGHTQRSRRIGAGACGPCWEEALRADERLRSRDST